MLCGLDSPRKGVRLTPPCNVSRSELMRKRFHVSAMKADHVAQCSNKFLSIGSQQRNLAPEANDHRWLVGRCGKQHRDDARAWGGFSLAPCIALVAALVEPRHELCHLDLIGRCFLGVDATDQCAQFGFGFERQHHVPHCRSEQWPHRTSGDVCTSMCVIPFDDVDVLHLEAALNPKDGGAACLVTQVIHEPNDGPVANESIVYPNTQQGCSDRWDERPLFERVVEIPQVTQGIEKREGAGAWVVQGAGNLRQGGRCSALRKVFKHFNHTSR